MARLSRLTLLHSAAVVWIEFFRGIPMLLVVYAFLLALPAFGVTFPRFWMLVIPMILVSSATTAEVFRAGINAVDRGQHEAAAAIGLSRRDAMASVVLPQAVRLVLPSLILALVTLLITVLAIAPALVAVPILAAVLAALVSILAGRSGARRETDARTDAAALADTAQELLAATRTVQSYLSLIHI